MSWNQPVRLAGSRRPVVVTAVTRSSVCSGAIQGRARLVSGLPRYSVTPLFAAELSAPIWSVPLVPVEERLAPDADGVKVHQTSWLE